MNAKPPIPIEQWVSLVLALASHRSSNEGHREFGSRVVAYVFDDLPSQAAEDETAKSYMRQMLAEVAWAVRGFSNVRDHFAKHVDSSIAVAEETKSQAKRMLEHSPLSATSLAGKGITALVGAGGGAALMSWLPGVPLPWIALFAVIVALAVHGAIEWISKSRVEQAVKGLPEKTMASWTSDAQARYEKVVRSFVAKAAVIERSHYPEQTELDSKAIDAIVCRAFSFGVQTSEHAPSGTVDDGGGKSP